MKRQLIGWLCLCLLLVRCTSDTPTELGAEPDNLIGETEMAAILTQVHLDEAHVAKLAIGSADTAALLFRRLQLDRLKKFDVDTATYTKSFIYYAARPDKMAKIYEQVLENLKAVEKEKSEKAGQSSKLKAIP